MKAEDFIQLIEQGRRDKISPNALDLIAKRFRELENKVLSQANTVSQNSQLNDFRKFSKKNYMGLPLISIEQALDDFEQHLLLPQNKQLK